MAAAATCGKHRHVTERNHVVGAEARPGVARTAEATATVAVDAIREPRCRNLPPPMPSRGSRIPKPRTERLENPSPVPGDADLDVDAEAEPGRAAATARGAPRRARRVRRVSPDRTKPPPRPSAPIRTDDGPVVAKPEVAARGASGTDARSGRKRSRSTDDGDTPVAPDPSPGSSPDPACPTTAARERKRVAADGNADRPQPDAAPPTVSSRPTSKDSGDTGAAEVKVRTEAAED